MSDDKSNRSEPDRSRINLSERYEVEYWKNKFGVNEQQLKDAVHKVGDSADKVQKELGK